MMPEKPAVSSVSNSSTVSKLTVAVARKLCRGGTYKLSHFPVSLCSMKLNSHTRISVGHS